MKTQQTPHLVAVLKPAVNVHDFLAQARAIIAAMTGNPLFPTPDPALGTLTVQADALEVATTAQTRVKGAAAVRDAKRRALLDGLQHLRAYVQKVADADPTNARTIITGAGLKVKTVTVHPKQDFVAKQGNVSGTVRLVAKASSTRASYEWQYSADQKTWTTVPATPAANTDIANLPPATTQYFRHRATTKAGVGDWSQVVSLIVK